MKTIKIKFVGFWPGFEYRHFFIYNILSKRYSINIVEDPDYIICSSFEPFYSYCEYPQVRIFYSGENYIPDFNLVDYSICEYPIEFLDRNYFFPGFASYMPGVFEELLSKNRQYDKSILEQKQYFANLICSHDSEHGFRGVFFNALNQYKRVESAGTIFNNMAGGKIVSKTDNTKFELQKKCKFSLCIESTKHEGFITEKIADAFYADSIPIYYGSSTIKQYFNPKAFIDVSSYDSIDSAIEHIIELDKNDTKYLEMLREPIFSSECVKDFIPGLEKYLYHIFDQPLDKAYRRSRVYMPQQYNNFIVSTSHKNNSSPDIVMRKIAYRLKKWIGRA